MKIKLSEILQDTKTVAISGHIRPDGDCVGSCIGLYLYIQQEFPDVQPTVYLEEIRDHIDHLELEIDDEIWPLPKYRELLFTK